MKTYIYYSPKLNKIEILESSKRYLKMWMLDLEHEVSYSDDFNTASTNTIFKYYPAFYIGEL